MAGFDYSNMDLVENPEPRCPVCLVLDCSDSMRDVRPGESQSPLDALNGALDTLVGAIYADPLSRKRVEISFLPYGGDVPDPTPFAAVDSGNMIVPSLGARGITNTGAALMRALDHVEARKQDYKSNGVAFYQPCVYLISDGLSMDDLAPARERIQGLQRQRKLSFFAIGVDGANMDELSSIGTREAKPLRGIEFDSLFEWISQSVASVSQSSPGDLVRVPPTDSWEVM